MSRVLMPLPAHDFDPTESAVPRKVLTDAGHTVVFATPTGTAAEADEVVIGPHVSARRPGDAWLIG